MLELIVSQHDKPNRLTDVKDEIYDAKYAKFCISNSSSALHTKFVEETIKNKRFYMGDQWSQEEDLEAFLKDDTGQDRNRIKVVNNIFRPLIENYRGNAIRLVINAAARSISPTAVNRREKALEEKLFLTRTASEVPAFSEYIKQTYNVGQNKAETIQIFENHYVDEYAEKITKLIRYIAEINKFADMQVAAAENLAFSGLVASEGYEYGGELRWKILQSERCFWDRSARKNDLSDSGWKGYWDEWEATDIYERYPDLNTVQMQAIENYTTSIQNAFSFTGSSVRQNTTKLPVFTVYWKDCIKTEYGYIKDEYGYPCLEKINYVHPGEEKPRFTDKDLIAPPDTIWAKKRFKNGRKKRNSTVDVIRYCVMIPSDLIATEKNQNAPDVVLEHGLYEYQDTEFADPSNVDFPIKTHVWAQVDGEVIAPVGDALNPQRLINRILSVAESQINNSGGANIVYDKDAVDAQDGEDQVMRDVMQGKPVSLRSKGKGIPNAIGVYDATPKAGTYAMFDIIAGLKQYTQDMTGVNEALRGESIGQDQLVGVTQMLIQRGSLMQEPFYYAISSLFLQMFQYNSNVGKRIYIDNERELSIMIGDDGVEILKLSKELKDEDFRVFVKKENMDEAMIAQGDNLLMILLQNQLIDKKIFANLFGRSTPSEVGRHLRQFTREDAEASRQRAQHQKSENQELLRAAQQENQNIMRQQESSKDRDFMRERQLNADKMQGKLSEQIIKGMTSRNTSPPPVV